MTRTLEKRPTIVANKHIRELRNKAIVEKLSGVAPEKLPTVIASLAEAYGLKELMVRRIGIEAGVIQVKKHAEAEANREKIIEALNESPKNELLQRVSELAEQYGYSESSIVQWGRMAGIKFTGLRDTSLQRNLAIIGAYLRNPSPQAVAEVFGISTARVSAIIGEAREYGVIPWPIEGGRRDAFVNEQLKKLSEVYNALDDYAKTKGEA